MPRAARHRDRLRLLLAGPAFLLLAVAGGAAAVQPPSPQAKSPVKDYALIYGTVWSANDTPAAGIPVTIRQTDDKKPRWQLVSDRRGEFAQRVPPGTQDYIIEADIKVPKGQPKPQVKVHIDNNERQDIGLHLPATEQSKK